MYNNHLTHCGRGPRSRRNRGNWNRMFRDMGMEFSGPWMDMKMGGRGRGRRSGRVLKSGELQLVILALVEEEPRHGYGLIEAIEQKTAGAYSPSPGVIYPTLTLLSDMGLIEEQPDGSRKLYAITAEGRTHLQERRDEADAIMERLEDAGGKPGGGDFAPIGRAMVNLGAALKLRVWERGANRDTSRAIADILDDAAKKISEL